MNKQEAIEYIKTLDTAALSAFITRLQSDPTLTVAAFEGAVPESIFRRFTEALAAEVTNIQNFSADFYHIPVEDYFFTFHKAKNLHRLNLSGVFYSNYLLAPIGDFTHLIVQEPRKEQPYA